MSKETIKVVEIDTNPAMKSLKDLRKELMEYKNQMANLEEGSDAFLEIANKAGEVKHQIDEINESIKGASADFGDMVGNVTNVAAGITGAFEAVAGGLQAIGVESEALDKAIARMQGLHSVTQGLLAIDDGIKSFDKLTTSINGTTKAGAALKAVMQPKVLLAIAAVITTIVLAFKNWEGAIRDALPFVDKICNAFGRVHPDIKKATEEQEKFNEKLKEEYAIIKAQNDETASEADKIRLQRRLDKLSDAAKAKLKTAQEDIILAQDNYNKALAKRVEVVMSGDAFALRVLDAQLKTYSDSIEKNKKIVESILTDDKWLKKQTTTPTAKTPEEELAERRLKAYNDEVKTIEYLKTLYDEIYGKDTIQYKKEELNLEERALSNIKSYFGETSEEYKTQLLLVLDLRKALEELSKPIEPTETSSTKDIEEALENDRLKEMAKGWLYNEETAIETFDRISEELKLALDRDLITQTQYDTAVKNLAKERTRYIVEQSVKTFSAASNFVTTLLDGIADQQDTNNKEGFEKSKKLQIASSTIQMLTGITSALSGAFTNKLTFADWILAGIQAATIAASGAMQIQKIKNTKFDGGGATANVSAGAINNMIVPPVQFSQAVQGASTQGAITNQKVYVTESDIVNTIGKVNVQESENTY